MRIYNIFPRVAGRFENWPPLLAAARSMGFDWIYVNPLHQPGFSGSLYSVRDYHLLNPDFGDEAALKAMLVAAHDLGLRVMMDLVINHAAIDSPLILAHRDWFVRDAAGEVLRPSCVHPDDATQVTVWGDLAEIDNAAGPPGLWDFWHALIARSVHQGFDGFRCDAAYHVPAALWTELIGRAPPELVWAAETLGCTPEQVESLAGCGFDYLFNASKWWQFDQPWCLDQHARFGPIAPSIGFPESHDTERLMQQVGGCAQIMRQRYAFAAAFSEGVMIPIGFERGVTKRLDVCGGTPSDVAGGELDLRAFIAAVNAAKAADPVWSAEGQHRLCGGLDGSVLVLEKSVGAERRLLVVNKDGQDGRIAELPYGGEAFRPFVAATSQVGQDLALGPAEVVYIRPR